MSSHLRRDGNDIETKCKVRCASGFTLLRVSKQMLAEAAPIVYERHTFNFTKRNSYLSEVKSLGDMRQYLTHVRISEFSVFLYEPTNLRLVVIDHGSICNDSREAEPADHSVSLLNKFARGFAALVASKARDGQGVQSYKDILPTFKITFIHCVRCAFRRQAHLGGHCHCCQRDVCSSSTQCRKAMVTHGQELSAKLRSAILGKLGNE